MPWHNRRNARLSGDCNFCRRPGSKTNDMGVKCEELLKQLNEFVDGTVDPAVCEEFQKHMAGCNPCQVVVDNIRKTITIYKEGKPHELPFAFRRRLHENLREKWKKEHPSTA